MSKSHYEQCGMPAFRITTTSGYSWVTSMAKGTTLESAAEYFIGNYFDTKPYPIEQRERAVKVEQIR